MGQAPAEWRLKAFAALFPSSLVVHDKIYSIIAPRVLLPVLFTSREFYDLGQEAYAKRLHRVETVHRTEDAKARGYSRGGRVAIRVFRFPQPVIANVLTSLEFRIRASMRLSWVIGSTPYDELTTGYPGILNEWNSLVGPRVRMNHGAQSYRVATHPPRPQGAEGYLVVALR